ncbi:MAG: ATP-binding protein [Flavobacteriales bacterium]
MIERLIQNQIETRLADKKAIVLYGPRQSGKTTLLEAVMKDRERLWLSGDEFDVRANFAQPNRDKLKRLVGSYSFVVIDEAQRIPEIGLAIKMLIDQVKTVKVLASGSSSFELANQVNEPLTGRKWEFQLWPLSFAELAKHFGSLQEKRVLENRLIFGSYPEIITSQSNQKEAIVSLAESYLYKDLLAFERIQKPEKIQVLLRALAYQIGSEVSFHELSQMCSLDKETVERYIQLLEKSFVIFRLPSFQKNLRNELKKSKKIYFVDNGIRNAIINQFAPLDARNDVGALWENYLMSERMKRHFYAGSGVNSYFWRTVSQQEIDLVEEHDGVVDAFEFKWNAQRKTKFHKAFVDAYAPSRTDIITPENYDDFLL